MDKVSKNRNLYKFFDNQSHPSNEYNFQVSPDFCFQLGQLLESITYPCADDLEMITAIIVRMKEEYRAEVQMGHQAGKVEEGRKEFEALREKKNIEKLNETMRDLSQITERLMKEGVDEINPLGDDAARSQKRKLVNDVEEHLLRATELTKRLKQ